jgi:hypothetical protein
MGTTCGDRGSAIHVSPEFLLNQGNYNFGKLHQLSTSSKLVLRRVDISVNKERKL